MSAESRPSLPFLTITSCLMANRCWLCEQTFPRGLTKQVFQVQNVLDYFQYRYKQEKDVAVIESSAAAAASSTESLIAASCPPIRTKNFSDCYIYYKKEMDEYGSIDNLINELGKNDLEMWMSGLICGQHGGCASDGALFLGATDMVGSSGNQKAGIPLGITFANNDCPPNCGCDNSWGFMSS